jgi:hypothetical protein
MKPTPDELKRQRDRDRLHAQRDATSLIEMAQVRQEKLEAAEKKLQAAEEEVKRAQDQAKLAQDQAKLAQDQAREGRERARLAGRIQILQQLLRQPDTPEEELLCLPGEDLLRLEEELNRQVNQRQQGNGPPTDRP